MARAEEKGRRLQRGREIRRFLEALEKQPESIEAWDEQAWRLPVSRATIHSDGSATFLFRGEIEITVRA